jgi:tripartite-type tricarboxylate transporter receptor subunit TctC
MPVAGFATFVNAFAVSGGTPAKSFNEYVNWVRTQGNGKGSVGVPAPASTPEFLVKVIGEKYKPGSGGGALPWQRTDDGRHAGQPDRGRRGLGAGLHREPQGRQGAGRRRAGRQAPGHPMPDVPTFAELGLAGFEDMPYYGIFAPAGTPKATVDQFSAARGQGRSPCPTCARSSPRWV